MRRFHRLAASLTLLMAMLSVAADFKPAGVPSSNKSDAISLPDPQEVTSKTRVVTIAATTKDPAATVEFIVFNLNVDPKDGGGPISSLASGKTLLIFPNDCDDAIVVLAYVLKSADGASAPVRTVITVKGPDKPAPKPGPAPKPVAKGKAAHASFIVADVSAIPTNVAAIMNDPGVRAALAPLGPRGVHLLGQNAKAVISGGLIAGVRKAGSIPCLVLQDAGGNILDAQPLTSPAAAKSFLEAYKGE